MQGKRARRSRVWACPSLPAFLKGLTDLGYVEGRNLTTVYRYADGKPERLAGLANELVALKPDVTSPVSTARTIPPARFTALIA